MREDDAWLPQDASAFELLGQRYADDSAETSHLRLWLEGHGIPFRFTLI
jgi:hypothetical protein